MHVPPDAVSAFDDAGYLVLRDFWAAAELDDLESQLTLLGQRIVGPDFSVHAAERYRLTPETQSLLYDRMRYLPALARLSGSSAVQGACRDLGLAHPSLMGCCNMRLDPPRDARHLFAWHQDSVYLLGSVNAVTVWTPLQKVDAARGTIQVMPGSHRAGLYPFKRISKKVIEPHVPMLQRDLALDLEVQGQPVTIEAKRGDVVIFKQMLLHRSMPNLGDQLRWTVQLRITDLSDPEHRRQRFPTGDRTNIFYVDYPGHDAAARRARESAIESAP
jgi:ectoine hydroxylase-related dioxygenase (phytanoyl-CoA dioxygenase family)